MSSGGTRATLRITGHSLPTVALAAALLTAGACEWAARTEAVRARLLAPGIGSAHRQFAIKPALFP